MTASEPKNWTRWLPAALIVAAVFAMYANSLRGPFVFDDESAVVRNESVRRLWSLDIFNPAAGRGETVGGRPLLNASLAVNYAISGTGPWSYHAVNVLIHALAALALFGLVRRTVEKMNAREGRTRSPSAPRITKGKHGGLGETALPSSQSTVFALAVALVWAAHPLGTGAVSYVAQRAESLCGLFYLAALYCFARGAALERGAPAPLFSNSKTAEDCRAPKRKRLLKPSALWLAASVVACFAAVATKEVAVTLPLMVFLYDRTFVAGSFRGAWRARRGCYLALASSWILLAALMLGQGGRGLSAGYASGMSWREYALTQCWAVIHYLRLAFWPAGQVFDYGSVLVRGFADVWPQAAALVLLLGATVWALAPRPVIGFLGAWFFVILAPTSSVAPVVTQTVAEHRMYLPLIAVAALVFGALRKYAPRLLPAVAVVVVVLLGAATIARNHVYRSAEFVWRDVTEKNPSSARAWANLGVALQQDGRDAEAANCYERAVTLNPNHAFAHANWGMILTRQGKMAEAIPHLRIAAALEPDMPDLRFNLVLALAAEGKTQAMAGRLAEAEDLLREAVRAQPDNAEAHGNLGNVLLMQERAAEAFREYEEVLRLKPDDRGAKENLELAREFLQQQQH